MEYFAGLDLGPVNEPSALAVVGKQVTAGVSAYAVRHLVRWQAGSMSYRDMAAEVDGVLRLPELGRCPLVIDRTGVGESVAALFRKLSDSSRSVVLSTGHAVTVGEDGSWYLPKQELVGTLQLLLQERRFQVAASLPLAALLTKEMANFRAKVVPAGTDPVTDWREGPQDDLVLAVGIAVWQGESDPGDAGMPLTWDDWGRPSRWPY